MPWQRGREGKQEVQYFLWLFDNGSLDFNCFIETGGPTKVKLFAEKSFSPATKNLEVLTLTSTWSRDFLGHPCFRLYFRHAAETSETFSFKGSGTGRELAFVHFLAFGSLRFPSFPFISLILLHFPLDQHCLHDSTSPYKFVSCWVSLDARLLSGS